jgi:hypothetical protein
MTYRHLLGAAALAAGLALTPLPAQQACLEYNAVSPMALEDPAKGYTGPTYAKLGDEVLIDKGDGIPTLVPPTTTCQDGVCAEWGARMKTDFGNGDTITIEVIMAVYDTPPVFGMYRGWNRIVEGTGRFEKATGTLYDSGPFFAWIDDKGIHSRFNGKTTGKICGVKPKAK